MPKRKPNLRLHVPTRLEKEQKRLIDELTDRLETATALATTRNNERVAALDERARARNAEKDAVIAHDKVLKENDELRRQLRERELDAERMRGYLDALEDAKPPQMIEAPRERKFGTYVNRDDPPLHGVTTYGGSSYGSPAPPRWWERPR